MTSSANKGTKQVQLKISFSDAKLGTAKGTAQHIEAETEGPPLCRRRFEMNYLRFKFHWSLSLRAQLTIFPLLVHIMAWHRQGDKPLSEPMIVSLLTHICATRLRLVKYDEPPVRQGKDNRLPQGFVNEIFCTCTLLLLSHPGAQLSWSEPYIPAATNDLHDSSAKGLAICIHILQINCQHYDRKRP